MRVERFVGQRPAGRESKEKIQQTQIFVEEDCEEERKLEKQKETLAKGWKLFNSFASTCTRFVAEQPVVMESAEKMLLVPADAVEKLQKKNMTQLDSELFDILHDNSLSEDVKWKLYSQILQRFLHKVAESQQPIEIPIVQQTPSAVEVRNQLARQEATKKRSEYVNEEKDDEIETSTPSSLQSHPLHVLRKNLTAGLAKKAEKLYKVLDSRGSISWTRDGEVSLGKDPLAGSNISDLISTAVRAKVAKKKLPIGWNNFAAYLIQEVPSELYAKTVTSEPNENTKRKVGKGLSRTWARFSF